MAVQKGDNSELTCLKSVAHVSHARSKWETHMLRNQRMGLREDKLPALHQISTMHQI
jgi:hypothetical protein